MQLRLHGIDDHHLLLFHRPGRLPPRRRATTTGQKDERHFVEKQRRPTGRFGRNSNRQDRHYERDAVAHFVDAIRRHLPAGHVGRYVQDYAIDQRIASHFVQDIVRLQSDYLRSVASKVSRESEGALPVGLHRRRQQEGQ